MNKKEASKLQWGRSLGPGIDYDISFKHLKLIMEEYDRIVAREKTIFVELNIIES